MKYRTPDSYSFGPEVDDPIATTLSVGSGGARHPAFPTLHRNRPSASSSRDEIHIKPALHEHGLMDLKQMIAQHKMQRSPSSGQCDALRAQQRGGQGLVTFQLQLARQQEEIDRLTAELSRARVESETVRTAFLAHIQSSRADKETIEELEQENEALRRHLKDLEDIEDFVQNSLSLNFTADEIIDAPYGKPSRSVSSPRPGQVPDFVAFDRDADEEDKDDDSDSGRAITAREMLSDFVMGDDAEVAVATDPFAEDENNVQVAVGNDHGYDLSEEAAEILSEYMKRREETEIAEAKAKAPSRCQSEGLIVGFGGQDTRNNGAARMLSKMGSSHRSSSSSGCVRNPVGPTTSGPAANSSQNSTWGLIRPNHRPTNSCPEPGGPAAHPSQNSLWGLMRSSFKPPSSDKSSQGLPASSSQRSLWGLRKSSTRNQGDVPINNASQNPLLGLMRSKSTAGRGPPPDSSPNSTWGLVQSKSTQHSTAQEAQGLPPAETTQNSTWGLIRSKSCHQQPCANKIPEDLPAKSPQNSSWGLIRSKSCHQPHADKIPEDLPVESPQNSSWGLIGQDVHEGTLAGSLQNANWDSVLAYPPPPTHEKQGVEFGASGDDWDDDGEEDEEKEERLRALVRERAASRKSQFDDYAKGRARSNSASRGDVEARGPEGVKRCSSLMGLERHSASAEKHLRDYILTNSFKGMRRVDSLRSIPESRTQ